MMNLRCVVLMTSVIAVISISLSIDVVASDRDVRFICSQGLDRDSGQSFPNFFYPAPKITGFEVPLQKR